MGLLDRFKKKNEQAAPAAPKTVKKQDEKVVSEKKPSKIEKDSKVSAKTTKTVHKVPPTLEGVVLKPLITEKSASLSEQNRYVFVVNAKANKVQVKQAVKALYGIQPTMVNIMNVQGKKIRFGRKYGKRNDWKKAVVTLPKGSSIDVYEGV